MKPSHTRYTIKYNRSAALYIFYNDDENENREKLQNDKCCSGCIILIYNTIIYYT